MLLREKRPLSWREKVVGSLRLKSAVERGRIEREGGRLGMKVVVLVPSCVLNNALKRFCYDICFKSIG